jgi:hypothetical protein
MTKPTLAEDISIAISCMQHYRDSIDPVNEANRYNELSRRIERLFRFYYQLTGYDPYEHQMNIAKQVMTEDSEALRNLGKE